MRNVLFILIAVLLLPCCVHQSQNGVRPLLKEAERMIRTSPDTAYFLLREMEASMDLQTKADSAYHGLLLMEAQAKNGIKLTDTTSLEKLTHYYKERQDSLMQIRLLRLRALVHHVGGRYEEAVKAYNIAISQANRMVEKSLLADMYYELAHLHYSAFLLLPTDSILNFADSLFYLTEQMAEEQKDSTLWMDALCSHYTIPFGKKDLKEAERLLLLGLNLAVLLKNKEYEMVICIYLSGVYEKMGEKEKSISFIRRRLAIQGNLLSKTSYYFALSSAYQQMGKLDSATYYSHKAKEFKKKEPLVKLSVPFKDVREVKSDKAAGHFFERMRQKEELERLNARKNTVLLLSIVGFTVILVLLCGYFRKFRLRHQEEKVLREAMEQLCGILEEDKRCLSEEYAHTQKLLKQKEELLQEKECILLKTREELQREKDDLQKEKEELQRKEKEIETLQLQLDTFSSEALRVLDKIKQIIADHRYKDCSDLKMDESDWRQLQWTMDKQWNGIVSRCQQDFQLSEVEVRLFCLSLMGVATSHIQFLLGIGRNSLYEMNHELFGKMGIERTSNTFKKDFKNFIETRK